MLMLRFDYDAMPYQTYAITYYDAAALFLRWRADAMLTRATGVIAMLRRRYYCCVILPPPCCFSLCYDAIAADDTLFMPLIAIISPLSFSSSLLLLLADCRLSAAFHTPIGCRHCRHIFAAAL